VEAQLMAVRWPDFYIVGAPKAGTTSLYEYLSAYPEVVLPEQKELLIFGEDLDVRNRRRWTPSQLEDAYSAAPRDAMRGLAYVWYLFSTQAAGEIREVRPDARIIIALREPMAALHALHSEFVYDGNEDIVDFADALAAQPDRCTGRRIPPEAHFRAGLCYARTVRYAEQVERYLDAFGPDQVHVLLFDELIADPVTTGSAVVRFLGIEPRPEISFPHTNPNKRARSAALRRFLAAPPPRMRRATRAAVPARIRRAAYRQAVTLNAARPPRAAISSQLRYQLRAELAPEIGKLEGLLGRSLSAWRAAE
jgi:sulfotransferase family protein